MKKIISTLSMLCLFAFVMVSCGSDDNDPDLDPQPTTTFGMSVNGQQFTPNLEPSAQLSNSGRFMVISATNTTTSEIITLSIGMSGGAGDALTANTYAITGSDSTGFNYFDGVNGFQADNGGQIVITSIDTETLKVSGSFQGIATGSFGSNTTYTITNGSFVDLSYTMQ